MGVRVVPIDVQKLDKGSFVSPDYIESTTGLKRGTKEYQLRLLSIRAYIEDDGLRLLTDPEAVEYTAAMHEQRVRQLIKTSVHTREIDVMKLDEGQRKQHERSMIKQGMTVQAIRKVRRDFSLNQHKRKVPKVLAKGP